MLQRTEKKDRGGGGVGGRVGVVVAAAVVFLPVTPSQIEQTCRWRFRASNATRRCRAVADQMRVYCFAFLGTFVSRFT